ncbi:hypothetical protein B0H21DRAFT_64552 [Amylocystis lapponica]|nr:hypothetical protein B0H21DRAFT_64552 [Amylocystis lapponica]
MFNHPTITIHNGLLAEVDILGKGRGVQAARPIAAGAIVLDEAPLFIKPLNAPYYSVVTEVAKLSEADRDAYSSLDNRFSDPAVYGIFKTNAIPYVDNSSVQGDVASGAGLLILGSRFNHSCRPNITTYFDERSQKFIFCALRDIRRGEEICRSYGCTLLAPRGARQAYLQNNCGFTCVCEVCSLSGHDLIASNERRYEIHRLYNTEIRNDQLAPSVRLEKVKQALVHLQTEDILHVYAPTYYYNALEFCICESKFLE